MSDLLKKKKKKERKTKGKRNNEGKETRSVIADVAGLAA